ncbi:hypothetical protein BV898_07958 [Hypsibius exemplaris]|uniref:G-protein coupled receptors family 1 profile domain-containing protein n=1 Tax=Hypsibius exemplaris TaxID=2072580 RepID=A0A1W0WS66_HYPEX|nr:hypothetical protein BV898_07958 [Hypsibius exemplaris]
MHKHLREECRIGSFPCHFLTPQLTPYHGVVDVFLYNPDGYLQRRYPAVHSTFGVVSIQFQLAPELKFGNWRIRAQIGRSNRKSNFPSRNSALFEVNVTQPVTILDEEPFLTGSIQANFTWGQTVTGNCTVEVFLLDPDTEAEAPNWDGKESLSIFEEYFFGVMDFSFAMEELRAKVPANSNFDGMILAVRVTVSDYWYNETRIGFSQTKVYNSSARLTFLGDQPQVFKPGMVFTTHLGVSQQNGAALHRPTSVEIRTQFSSQSSGSGFTQSRIFRVPDDGVLFLETFVPRGVSELLLEAYDLGGLARPQPTPYDDSTVSKTRMTVLRHQSVRDHVIQLTSTTRNAKVGEYLIVHVRASYFMQTLTWIVSSKGLVILSGREEVSSRSYTFSVAVTSEMAPKAHLVVFDVLPNGGDVIADKFTFPVDGISRNKFSLSVNQHKDYYKRTVELVVLGNPLAFVGFSAVDRNLYPLTPGLSSLTRSDILRTLHQAESPRYGAAVPGMTFMSADGFADWSVYFASNSHGLDTFSMFDQADLAVFSDAKVFRKALTYCDASAGESACVSGGCFRDADRCDGVWNCRDGTDEGQCNPVAKAYEEMLQFRRTRFNHLDRSFAFACCWTDGTISPEGHFIIKREKKMNESWRNCSGNSSLPHIPRVPVLLWTWSPICLVMISILGSVTNGTALLVFLKERALRSSFNIYIIHLLLLNFVCSTAQFSISAVAALHPREWVLGDRVCDFYLLVQSMPNAATRNMHGLMAANRAWAIFHPLSYREWNSERFSLQVCVGLWVYLALVELPYWVMDTAWYRPRGLTTTRTCQFTARAMPNYITATALLIFTLPVLLVPVSFVTVAISKVVRAHRRPSSHCPRRNTIAAAVGQQTPAGVPPAPFSTLYFIVRQYRPSFSVPVYLDVANVLQACHGMTDPVLLSLAVDRFWAGLKQMLPCRPGHRV